MVDRRRTVGALVHAPTVVPLRHWIGVHGHVERPHRHQRPPHVLLADLLRPGEEGVADATANAVVGDGRHLIRKTSKHRHAEAVAGGVGHRLLAGHPVPLQVAEGEVAGAALAAGAEELGALHQLLLRQV